jgi:cellulose synthase/poly-beta-1,6-N-acetylglucosamine synthase-like glycosyltransferase
LIGRTLDESVDEIILVGVQSSIPDLNKVNKFAILKVFPFCPGDPLLIKCGCNPQRVKECKMDIIRSWPRWLQGGFFSVVVAGILYLVGFLIKPLAIFSFGIVAPSIISMSLSPVLPESIYLFIAIHIGYWFLIGALLGRFIKNLGLTTIIWLVVQIFGGIIAIFLIGGILH